jgi:hypothetical protein
MNQADYVAIEMVNGQIKASWDLGSGVKSLLHPLKLILNIEDPKKPDELDHWFQIYFERYVIQPCINVAAIFLEICDFDAAASCHSIANNFP